MKLPLRAERHKRTGQDRWSLNLRQAAIVTVALLLVVLASFGKDAAASLLVGQSAEEDLLESIGASTEDLGLAAQTGAVPKGSESAVSEGQTPESASATAEVLVYVSGEVVNPGVVSLPVGSRVVDALEKVGGPGEDADLETTNLARVVTDGEQIHIPSASAASTATGPQAPVEQAPPPCIDVNVATAQELEQLVGIGPALSQRIVDHREQNGAFLAKGDLRLVAGIGPKVFAGIEADLCGP